MAQNDKIKTFFERCDEMISGKFIISDIKISNLLKSIATCEELYNLFAKSLVNFNYKQEFRNAIRTEVCDGGFFVLPEDNSRLLPLVFCILLDMDNQKFSLQSFINEYFYHKEGYNYSYASFAHNFLVPFKNAVQEVLNADENGNIANETTEEKYETLRGIGKMEEQIQVNDTNKILYANLVVAVNDLYSAVLKNDKIKADQKNEVFIITNAIKEALKIENIKIVNALVIPLEYILGKDKRVKIQYDNVKMCLIKIFNALSNN